VVRQAHRTLSERSVASRRAELAGQRRGPLAVSEVIGWHRGVALKCPNEELPILDLKGSGIEAALPAVPRETSLRRLS